MAPQKVLADPAKWLANGSRETVSRNTHAIAWLDRHVRNPAPRRLIWDLRTRATSRGKSALLHYWLDLSSKDASLMKTQDVIARLDKATNSVTVEKCGDYLKVLLRHGMLDLAQPVRLKVGGRTFQVSPEATRGNLLQTMIDRGDPNYMFEASISIQKKEDAFTVTVSD